MCSRMERTMMVVCLLCLTICSIPLMAQDVFGPAEQKVKELAAISGVPVNDWHYRQGEIQNALDGSLDDQNWLTSTSSDFTWGDQRTAWFRTSVVIPEQINGIKIAGNTVLFKCRVRREDNGVIYVNNNKVQSFYADEGRVLLTQSAIPGEKFEIAIQGIDTGGDGGGKLNGAWLEVQAAEEIPFLLATYDYAKQTYSMADQNKRGPYLNYILNGIATVDLDALRSGNTMVFLQSVKSAISQMGRLDEFANGLTIHLIGHAHIDLNWQWDWLETQEVCKNTFNTAAKLMDEYPDFCLSQSQAAVYLAMQENHPEVFEKIRERVKRGQWDITATMWAESDTNMTSGEALVRSILYGKRYIKKEFGVESVVGWEPDTFGHPWTLPQILAKSGIKYYYFTRCDKGLPIFWWQSPDDSRVLAYRTISYDNSISDHVANDATEYSKLTGLKHFMRVYGVGDHGGGPTRAMLDYAKRLQSRPSYPKTVFDTTVGYFDAAAQDGKNYQVWNNELNTIFEGCYTTHADAKRGNRKSEALLPCAEKFAVMSLYPSGKYPAKGFEESWRNVCFNQFHDLLCGTSIHSSHDSANKLYAKAAHQAGGVLESSLESLIARIDSRGKGVPIVVFNPLSWTRSESVEIASTFPDSVSECLVKDSAGAVSPAQNRGGRLYFTARGVPALGYKVFWAYRTQKVVRSTVKVKGNCVENEFFKVEVGTETGALTSVYDKTNNRELLPPGESGAKLQVLLEQPHHMSAWEIGEFVKQEDLLGNTQIALAESGPARASLEFDHKYGKSTFKQKIILYEGVPRIDIRMKADWQEIGDAAAPAPMLKVAFPTSLINPKATFEIPFGSIERPTNGKEVPAQKWIDISEGTYGVSLLNDCKYGFDVNGSVMRMTLLRSPYEPDPIPDVGKHEITYSLYPHKGGWREAGTVRRGYEINEPLIARVANSHKGSLPTEMSYVSLSAPSLVVTALKQAEDGDGTIIRFYESSGFGCKTQVKVKLPAGHYVETDLMERPIAKKIAIKGGVFTVSVGKWEIKTYKLLR